MVGLDVNAFLDLSELENLDAIELCDVLWLSKYMKTDKNYYVEKENTNSENTSKKTQSKNKKEAIPQAPTNENTKTQSSTITIEENKDIGLSTSTNDNIGDSSYYVPHKGYFEDSNKLTHYLRGFNKKISSKRKSILNEDKTVDYIANTHVTKVFFQPRKVKKYELYLTIDISNSMKLWEEMIITYSQLLTNSGVFRSVKKIYIDADNQETIFYRDKHKLNRFSINEINNPHNNKLFFVLSDMESKAWRDGDAFEIFSNLFKKVSLFMMQMLPYRLWKGTALYKASLAKLKTKEDYPINGDYISELDHILKRLDDINRRDVKLPIALFELESLKVIGATLQTKHNNTIDGAVINLNHTVKAKENQTIDASVTIDNFFVNASREAQKLMISLAAVPLNIPIMRMIQEKILKDTNNIYLAEVLNSKLLIKDGDFFKFIDDEIHDELYKLLGREAALEIAYNNSDYIQENLNAKFGFKALLAGEVDLEKIDFSTNEKIFASISCKILKSLGVAYAKKSGCKDKEKQKAIIPHSKRFQMGSEDGSDDEKPVHEVVFNYDFEIAQYPVTFEEYDLFCEDIGKEKPNDEGWGRGKRPVINVSWHDAKEYCKWLSGKTGEDYRLPTEAEWEYSARAGTTTKWSFGDTESELEKYAWYSKNSDNKTYPVGKKLANPWGLYDKHGNVWEWCESWYDDYDGKILRGGSWFHNADLTSSFSRFWYTPDFHYSKVGFRLLKTLPSNEKIVSTIMKTTKDNNIPKEYEINKKIIQLLKNIGWNDKCILKDKKSKNSRVDIALVVDDIVITIIEIKVNLDTGANFKKYIKQLHNYALEYNVDFAYLTDGEKIYEYSVKSTLYKEVKQFPSKTQALMNLSKNSKSNELVIYQCEECDEIALFKCNSLHWETVSGSERNMGQESEHQAIYIDECEKCNNEIEITLTCWEYPVGAENTRDIEARGANILSGDCCLDFHESDKMEYIQDAIEEIKEWFSEHYEDPAEHLPYESKEGGYQWIYGGPVDTEDAIKEKFWEKYDEDILQKAIEEIGRYEEWSPILQSEDEFQDALGLWAKRKADEDES